MIRALVAWDRPETSACALSMAALAGDDRLRRRLRRDIADRGHHLSGWLVQLHRTEPVGRAVELSTPFRVEDELLVGVLVAGGYPLTALIRVDNELGFRAAGVTMFTEHLDTVLRRIEEPLGEVTITEADEVSSVGRYSGPGQPKVGDAVKSTQ